MPSFAETLIVASCLVFVIEGLIYALFPGHMKRLMAMAMSIPQEQLRVFGLIMASGGIILIYLFKFLRSH